MKAVATVLGLLGGVAESVFGVTRMISGAASSASPTAGLGLISLVIGLCTIAIAAVVVRKNPTSAGVELLMLGTVGLLLFWPGAAATLAGAVVALVAVTERYGRAPLRIAATVMGALGGAIELVLGLRGAGVLFAQSGRMSTAPSLPEIGRALLALLSSGPGMTFLAGCVAIMAATLATRKHPIVSGILLLLAGAASFILFWPAAALIIIGGILALVGVTELEKGAAPQAPRS